LWEDIQELTDWCEQHAAGAAPPPSAANPFARSGGAGEAIFAAELRALSKIHELVMVEANTFAPTYRELLATCPDAKLVAAEAIAGRRPELSKNKKAIIEACAAHVKAIPVPPALVCGAFSLVPADADCCVIS
jgi:hypothetical protein